MTDHLLTRGEGKPVYGMPHNEKEFNRLDVQHEAVTLVFEGLNVCNEEVDRILGSSGDERRVLDLGSGSGVWFVFISC